MNSEPRSAATVDLLDAALDTAYADLLWISEYPNRVESHPEGDALSLAEMARLALANNDEVDSGY